MAGILNLIPYIGSTLALLPSLVIAAFIAPSMVLKVIIVFLVEQTIETRVISPIIVGNKMQMHPVTTILVLLVSAIISNILKTIVSMNFQNEIRWIIK